MIDINFKDIRVLSSQLELKGNTTKRLVDLVNQLQTSSFIKGLVVGNTPKGEIIFHTAIGRFISPNPMNLSRGNVISIRLVTQDDELNGSIIKIGDTNVDKSIKIAFISDMNASKTSHSKGGGSIIEIGNSQKLPEVIKCYITYINLSKIDDNSMLHKLITKNIDTNAKNNTTIEFRLVTDKSQNLTPLQINGEIAGVSKDGYQIIKTNFAIMNAKGTDIPDGQKLTLEIISINNKYIFNDTKQVTNEFIINMNKNWNLLKQLEIGRVFASQNLEIDSALENLNKNQRIIQIVSSDKISLPESFKEGVNLSTILSNFDDLNQIKKLSSEISFLKEIYGIPAPKHNDQFQILNVMIPFYNGTTIEAFEIRVSRPKENYLRFLLDSEFITLGKMQLDGLVKFDVISNNPCNFDLIIRTEKKANESIRHGLIQIFEINQSTKGIAGNLVFAEF